MKKVKRKLWRTPEPNTYRLLAWLIAEDDGGYSLVSFNLPGVGSQGDSIVSATVNFKEAAIGVIQSYLNDGIDIPWVLSDGLPQPPNSKRMTVFVTVAPIDG